jgi:hypothetical protein
MPRKIFLTVKQERIRNLLRLKFGVNVRDDGWGSNTLTSTDATNCDTVLTKKAMGLDPSPL